MVAKSKQVRKPRDRSRLFPLRVPDGPEYALSDAIAILGPYPWIRPKQLEVPNSIHDLPEIVTEEAMLKQITKIGSYYLNDLERDAAAVRVKDALGAFGEIADLSDRLADALAALSGDERHFLTMLFPPEPDFKTWNEHIFCRLPPLTIEPGKDRLPEGTGVQWLRLVAEHMHSTMRSLAAYQKSGTSKTGDLGGKSNLNRLRGASPGWELVKKSWQLFAWAPHCQPSGTAQGRLHEFLGHVHEWVTGENVSGTGKFESHIKAFSKPWQRSRRLMKDFARLERSLPKDIAIYLEPAVSGVMPDRRILFSEAVLAEAERLRAQINEVSKIMRYGPRQRSRS